MENGFKRFLSLVVAIVMVIGMVPMNAFATESTGEVIIIDDDSSENTQTAGDDASVIADTDTSEQTETDSDATEIGTVDELQAFAAAVNGGDTFAGKVVKLTADLDLAGINWTPIGNTTNYFRGTFDGQNHTISNMTINVNTPNTDQFLGLFGGVQNAVIKNLTMKDVSITAVGNKVRAAAVVGIADSDKTTPAVLALNFENITVDGCTINAEAASSSALLGGVVGYCYPANMKDISVSDLTINGKAANSEVRVAAICGYVCGQNISNNGNTRMAFTVENFDVKNVSITAEAYTVFAGGYAPYTYYGYITLKNGTIEGLEIDVDAHEAFVGGLVGYFWRSDNGHTVQNVNITNIDFDVTTDYLGETRVGGMVGTSQSPNTKYTDCSVSGKIVERCSDSENPVNYHAKVGGFVARTYEYAQQTYTNCVADVDVTGSHVAGGFVGNHTSHVNYYNCDAKGDVTANIAGGFAGRLTKHSYTQDVTFDGCTASGDVNGTNVAGGFIGSTVDHGWTAWVAGEGTPYAKNVTLQNCEVTGNVTSGTEYCAGVVGEAVVADGVELTLNDVSYVVDPAYYPADSANVEIHTNVAQVGDDKYETLKEAVAAANAVEGGATVTLLADVTLGEKLTISGNVTISGEYTITRDDAYTGTLFTVNAGATLTLDGGLVIDGNNNWSLNEELYNKALKLEVTGTTWADLITSEEGKPNATAPMFKVTGSVVAKNVTIQNNYSNKSSNNGDYGVFQVDANATLTMTGATVKHIVTGGANSVAHLSTNSVWTINDGTLITDTFAGKNGGVCRNDSGKLVMNGGTICTNRSINTNGTVVMLYKGSMEMNGGTICHNTGISGANNGRCAPIYGHSTSTFVMTDGTIKENQGISYGGVDVPSSIKVEISGGYIGDNISALGNTNADVNGNSNTVITGGTFTQDVSAWLAPDTGLVYDEETGTYGTTDHIYNLWFYDPATGEQAQDVGPLQGNDPASLVALGKLFYADYYIMELEVLSNAKIDETIVIDYPMTINLNGKTITGVATDGVDLYPVIRVQGGASVIVKNGEIVNADYIFVLGASDGSSAGYLTIESGTYTGETTVASVTKGTLTVNGGTFAVTDEPTYLLNCIDANYRDGSAKIEVNGGSFYKFNPANNAAEGAGTSFVADGYLAEADGDYYTVRQNKDALDPIVTITFTDNTGSEVTLKYPSERYDSIQKLIGTNDYADFVLGATQSELLAYIANGTASNIVITLHDDIELDAPINFYNKYFQMSVEYSLTIDGNGHTITWADGYTGTLINVESGVSVEMKNLTIDGENAFTFYNDTTTVEDGQNWYTRFVNVGEEDKAVNADVIVNAGNLTLKGVTIQNVTIASDSGNGKTSNTEDGGFYLMYNDDLALIKSNGGSVVITNNGSITYNTKIIGNAGLVLNAVNANTQIIGSSLIQGNMGCGNKGGIIIANGGTMEISGASGIVGNKAMARSATILGVINGAEVTFGGQVDYGGDELYDDDTSMHSNKHIGVGSNTAGAMIVLEGASRFVMNGGSIYNNVGGRAGAIASRWVGGSYGQHEETSIVLNAGTITRNTASNDSWSGASIFLRSPATIGAGMKIDGTIAVNAAPGELDITGGTFTNFKLIVTDGLSAEITGGTFDSDPAAWLAEGYVAPENNGTYTAREQSYVEWVQEQLFAGNSVTLTEDIVITDYDLVHAHAWPSNGNGKYTEVHGNGAIFHVIKPGVVLDLNGYDIIWDAHDADYCNKRQVSLFMVTITGNAGETSSLTVKDSVGGGKVDVYGMGTGMYVVGVDATGTIAGGTWTNYPCKTCAASNIFIYPSHGGKLVIEGGTFEQKNSEYLLGWMGSTKETTNNGVGVDYDQTQVVISGGTFVNFNPAEVKFFDYSNSSKESESNGCAPTYVPVDDGNGNYNVEVWNGATISNKYELQAFADMANAGNKFSGKTVTLMADIDLGGETWTPIKSFAGTFDGGNHTISNFKLDSTNADAGFFAYIGQYPATAKNLTLANIEAIAGANELGILAATAHTTVVSNVTIKDVKVTTTHSNARVGGFFAYFNWTSATNSKLVNFEVDATKGAEFIGGYAGWMDQNDDVGINNVDIDGFKITVSDTDGNCEVGGFTAQTQTGWRDPLFQNCDVTGIDITATGTVTVGGFVANPGAHTRTTNCTTEGKIDATGVTDPSNYIGGFFGNAGWNDNLGSQGGHKLTNCSADVQIITGGAAAGGFIGSATNDNNANMPITFTNCEAKGTVTVAEGATANIGGFAGEADRGTYTNCTVAQDPFIGSVATGSTLTNTASYVASVGEEFYANFNNALAAAKDAADKTVTLLAPVVITEDTTLDLTGVKVDGNGVYPAFRIQNGANVTVKGGEVINATDYIFVLGASDGSSAGNLTIESGSYTGNTSVASVTKGVLTITGGEFQVNSASSTYLLNCIDANYTAGTAKIVVTGGTFHNFNPADNAAEGANTNFCPWGYDATEAEGVYTVSTLTALEIWTIEDLNRFNAFAREQADNGKEPYAGVTVKLMADIDLNWAEWYPINFYGTFEGNNHTISNLTYVANASNQMGFFNTLGGPANNLTLDGIKATVPSGGQFGGFARYINYYYKDYTIQNNHVKNVEVTSSGGYSSIGGFTYYTKDAFLKDCSVENIVIDASAGAEYVAGFYCMNYDGKTYTNCDVKNVKITLNAGNIGSIASGFVCQTQIGHYTPSYINCDVTGIDITVSGWAGVAGFVAWPGAHTTITNCTTEGKIDASGLTNGGIISWAGGFLGNLGWNNNESSRGGHKLTDCTADVDVITKLVPAGGFVGSATNSYGRNMAVAFTNCVAEGAVTVAEGGTAVIGGFAGNADRGTYTNCSAAQEPFIGSVVEGKTLTNVNSYVAKVGGSYYASFENALAADGEITLLANVELTKDVEISIAGVVLNANGYELDCNGNEIILTAEAATLEAAEGLNVTTNVADYKVVYENGTYKLAAKNYVAQIGDVKYESLQDAINAAENGDKIVVLADINLADVEMQVLDDSYDTYFLVEGKSITVDLNGKKISGAYTGSMLVGVFSTDKNGKLTLTGNGTVDVTATGKVYALIAAYSDGSSIIIENGTYTLDKASDSLIYCGGYTDAAVTVKGGTFTLGNVGTGENGKPWIFNVLGAADHYILITGGTFNADINRQHWSSEAVVDKTCYMVNNGDGTWTVKAGAVAYVNTGMTSGQFYMPKDVGYATIEEAFAAAVANNDPSITLLKDVKLADNVNISITGIVLNTNGFTLDCGDYEIKLTAAEATLTAPEGLAVTTTVEGYEVEYVDGVYTVVEIVRVAKIGDVEYKTLADAIAAAKAGDTIVLIANVNEDVTVNKSLTIDGGNFKYTGNISVSGSNTAVTVKNVNFVDGTDYAITTNRIKSITVENCTVKNYGAGFLYANKSTPNVVVKNVTVEGGNYGFHWAYGTTATLENVKMTNVAKGLYIQNYAGKTITLKNCEITSIAIWERTGYSGVQTFKFEGVNKVATLSESQYAKYVLPAADATLTAPEGFGVTTDVADHKVVYENGVYKVAPKNYVAQVGETKFESLQEAIEAANTGDTVTLLKDIALTEADRVANADRNVLLDVVGKDITLDMAGKKISVEHMDAFTNDYIVAVIRVADGAGLTVTGNGTIDVEVLENNPDMAYMFWKRGTTGHLTIENGTFHMNDSADSMVYTNGNEIVNIKGGTWTLDTYGTRGNREPWIFNVAGAGDNHVTVTGGTFNADINRQFWSNEVLVPETYYTVDNGNGTWTVKEGAVAYVATGMLTGPYFAPKNIGYATIEEAFAAAVACNDVNITLLQNVQLTKDVEISIAGIILNANGYTLDCNGHKIILTAVDATLTAPEGLTVTTNVADYKVAYENGTYKLVAKNYVAQIGETKFESLQEAIEAANTGDTIVVIADIDLAKTDLQLLDGSYDTYFLVEGKSVTIDLNGKTISGAYSGSMLVGVFSTDNDGKLTLTGNGTVDVTATGKVYALIAAYSNGSSIIIENGTYKLDKASDSLVYYGGKTDAEVTVKGGTFNLGNVGTGENGKPWIFNVLGAGDHHVYITGGTFNADINRQHWSNEAVVAKTHYVVNNGDGTWTVKDGAVAYVHTGMVTGPFYAPKDVGYATIEEAFAAAVAANDVNITLLQNVQLTKDVEISIAGIVLNANGYTLDCNGNEIILTKQEATLAAPAGLNVTTTVASLNVVYENGVYKLPEAVAINENTGNYYSDLTDALDAAKPGETVKLLRETTEVSVVMLTGITLDLNGNTLNATYVVTIKGNHIVDSNADHAGLLKATKVVLDPSNEQLPVLNEDKTGYQFFTLKMQQVAPKVDAEAGTLTFKFKPSLGSTDLNTKYWADGAADNGLKIGIRLSWINANGMLTTQDFFYGDTGDISVMAVYTSKQTFEAAFSGISGLDKLTITSIVVSDTGAEYLGEVHSVSVG